jgi:signal transduction histidine kinase
VVLVLLAAWFVLVLVEPLAERVWRPSFVVYLAAQGVVVFLLLGQSSSSDFFAVLLAVPVMQAMDRWRPRAVAVLIGLFALLTGVALKHTHLGVPETVSLTAFYAVANVFFAAYALAARRAVEARECHDALAADLRAANQRLTESAEQAERLGAARERQRLARDLHDSVTQTLFSMTLTAKSALLLLRRGPDEVRAQLDQLDHLTRSALEELDALSAELSPSVPVEGGLVAMLERHRVERRLRDGLAVTLEVDGDDPLPVEVEHALLRIAQEGLNNVVKHAGVGEATVRVRLRHPCSLEVEDRGGGFDPERARATGLGLTSMRERAAEVGWSLVVTGAPGGGTRVVAEEGGEGGRDGG